MPGNTGPEKELLILVDEQDRQTGVLDKMAVHRQGLLHRAFSVFIFNTAGELLLQQRAEDKYHSPGLWSNTCCSHPRDGEKTLDACKRRLEEEMGLRCELTFAFSFMYREEFGNGLTEHEFDHVYLGYTDSAPSPDPAEIMNWKYVSRQDLDDGVVLHPEAYTAWLKICLPRVWQYVKKTC